MKTFLKRLSGILLVLAGLLLMFHGIENWRGAQALARWEATTKALGQPMTLEELAPPPIPDAENFALHPGVADAIAGRPQPSGQALPAGAVLPAGPVLPAALSNGELFRAWEEGRAVDQEALKTQLKVADLSSLLEPFSEQLRGLEEASLRPHSRIMRSYGDDIPGLLGMRQRARALSLRALISLRAGKPEAALNDVLTLLRVIHHLELEPQLLCQLLRIANMRIAMQPIWEGLHEQRWSEAQLQRLQAGLGGVDLLVSWRRSWTAEQVYTRQMMQKMAAAPFWPRAHYFGDPKSGRIADYLFPIFVPKGWIQQNQIRMEQQRRAQLIDIIEPARHTLDARGSDGTAARWAQNPRWPYSFLAKLFLVDLSEQNLRLAHTQSSLDQALVACALERHRLAHHAYPERLQDLVPTFAAQLPGDLINHGLPLHYRKGAQGYRLYSLGWDGLDQGGQVALETQKSPHHNLKQGDWTWERGD